MCPSAPPLAPLSTLFARASTAPLSHALGARRFRHLLRSGRPPPSPPLAILPASPHLPKHTLCTPHSEQPNPFHLCATTLTVDVSHLLLLAAYILQLQVYVVHHLLQPPQLGVDGVQLVLLGNLQCSSTRTTRYGRSPSRRSSVGMESSLSLWAISYGRNEPWSAASTVRKISGIFPPMCSSTSTSTTAVCHKSRRLWQQPR